jgi:hypothetical protein
MLTQSPNNPRPPQGVKRPQEREKKETDWHFSPFVVSTDGLLGKESCTLLKKLSALLTKKWEKL